MRVDRLELVRFRSYRQLDVEFAPNLTAIVGANGQGKTNLLEAIAYLARVSSFRGAPPAAMISADPPDDSLPTTVVRGHLHSAGRELLIEAELRAEGRPRVLVNRQPLRRRADLAGAFQVTVFRPDDLELVKSGPSIRREYLDEVLVSARPAHAGVVGEVEKILRQRNTLLKQVGRRLSPEEELTLDVWDERLAVAGTRLGDLRREILERLGPYVADAYDRLAGTPASVTLRYSSSWQEAGLAESLRTGREEDLRRKVSLVGPHRDDVVVELGGLDARHQASQGEQRCLALALRLAAHRLVIDELGATPVLLLDDVFSELDPDRSSALIRALPVGQAILTSASPLPDDAHPELVLHVAGGAVGASR